MVTIQRNGLLCTTSKRGRGQGFVFKVKDMDMQSGGPFVAVLNIEDAKKLDLKSSDRILVRDGGGEVPCILNIAESKRAIRPGKIGLYEEVLDALNVKRGHKVTVHLTGKPESVRHIRDKLHGKELTYKELYHIIRDITCDRLTSIEKTYFVAAGFANGWTKDEVIHMTKAMVETGQKIKFGRITLDKHCIGGVPGNRTTMIVIPIIAAAGFTIPKTSSRAITSPAGTADTMECLANVEISEKKIRQVVKKTNACIVHGGSMNLAPADDKIIEVEHPLSIDAEGQLLASVMAKKCSVSANHVLIDIPMGPEVKAKTKKDARHLQKMFTLIGKSLEMNMKVIITDGTQPIGNGIGPVLEAEDVMAVLRNDPLAPADLRDKALEMSGILLKMAGKKRGTKLAKELLGSGKAFQKMKEIIRAQGRQKNVPLGKHRHVVRAKKAGKVTAISNKIIAKVARIAGAPGDKGAGLFLGKKQTNNVRKGDVLYTIYAHSQFKLTLAKEFIRKDTGYFISPS